MGILRGLVAAGLVMGLGVGPGVDAAAIATGGQERRSDGRRSDEWRNDEWRRDGPRGDERRGDGRRVGERRGPELWVERQAGRGARLDSEPRASRRRWALARMDEMANERRRCRERYAKPRDVAHCEAEFTRRFNQYNEIYLEAARE
jgi:hypothetical protein